MEQVALEKFPCCLHLRLLVREDNLPARQTYVPRFDSLPIVCIVAVISRVALQEERWPDVPQCHALSLENLRSINTDFKLRMIILNYMLISCHVTHVSI